MPIIPRQIRFLGRVYPAGLKLSIQNQPPITFVESNGLVSAEYHISLVDSSIEVDCNFDNVTPRHPYELWQKAIEIVQVLVDLCAFQMGAGAITILDRWINEEGKTDDLALADPLLGPVCTAFGQDHRFGVVANLVLLEPAIFTALNDLVLSNVISGQALINSARAVETIRNLIAGTSLDRTKAWTLMQNVLNADRAYVSLITQHSIAPRHGDQVSIAPDTVREVRLRAWTLMNRFLHYRLWRNQPLPHMWFPMLTG